MARARTKTTKTAKRKTAKRKTAKRKTAKRGAKASKRGAKQSNPFQRLVVRIHETYRSPSDQVTESAHVKEPDGVLREVDVLVTSTQGDKTFRVAIECRDHTRAATILWLDGILGKYLDLGIDRIVCINRRGFSASARAKAKRKKVDLYTLDAAQGDTWPKSLIPLWVVPFHEQVSFTLNFEFDPPVVATAETPALRIVLDQALADQELLAEYREKRADPSLNREIWAKRRKIEDRETPIDISYPTSSASAATARAFIGERELTIAKRIVTARLTAHAPVPEHARHLMKDGIQLDGAPTHVVTEAVIGDKAQQRVTLVEKDGAIHARIAPNTEPENDD